VRIYKTDAGVLDKGGVPQPAYLNFEMALNTFPKETLKVGSSAALCSDSFCTILPSGAYSCAECSEMLMIGMP